MMYNRRPSPALPFETILFLVALAVFPARTLQQALNHADSLLLQQSQYTVNNTVLPAVLPVRDTSSPIIAPDNKVQRAPPPASKLPASPPPPPTPIRSESWVEKELAQITQVLETLGPNQRGPVASAMFKLLLDSLEARNESLHSSLPAAIKPSPSPVTSDFNITINTSPSAPLLPLKSPSPAPARPPQAACPDLQAMQEVRADDESIRREWKGEACPCNGSQPTWAPASSNARYECSEDGRVTSLTLNWMIWYNELPTSIGKLTALQNLDIRDNREMTGSLPVEFSALTKLRTLRQGGRDPSRLAGAIPAQWGAMTSLETLELQDLDLSKGLPSSFSSLTRLQTLSLKNCSLTGVPPALRLLRNLTKLDLSGNNMVVNGQLPLDFTNMSSLRQLALLQNTGGPNATIPEEYRKLTALESLKVDKVKHDTIPRWFGTLKNLKELVIHNASMSGPIPEWLTEMTSLTHIDLDSNNFTDGFPVWFTLMKNLTDIRMPRNPNLRGSLPQEYSNMTQLKRIAGGSSGLTGTLPGSWSHLTNLENMWLDRNMLEGTLPASWGNLAGMKKLWLFGNPLTGSLPAQWSNMTGMIELMIYDARLNGSLPSEYNNWKGDGMDSILLQNNSLTGPLPASWHKFTTLRQFGLAYNQLDGGLPDTWTSMSKLEVLMLQNNSLSGPLPTTYSSMTNIKHVQLQHNKLTGALPDAWAAMTQMISLDLSWNYLSGTLPASWGAMKDIVVLNLHDNKHENGTGGIKGPLPAEWGFEKASILSLHNNSINGSMPESWSKMVKMRKLDLSMNRLEGQLPGPWSAMAALQMLDVSDNQLGPDVPPEWSAMKSLEYLGLQGNKQLCTGHECLNRLSTSMGNRSYVSVSGGVSIPEQWVKDVVLPQGANRTEPMLLFVGQEPSFDGQMVKVCLDRNPKQYRFTWVSDFNLAEAQRKLQLGSSSATVARQHIDSTLDVTLVDDTVANTINATLQDVHRLIKQYSDGWVLGGQDWNDPCVPRAGRRNTYIAFGLFGSGLLLILADWFLKVKTGESLAKRTGRVMRKIYAWLKGTPADMQQDTQHQSSRRRAMTKARKVLHGVMLLAAYTTPYFSTASDVIMDLVLIRELWGHKTGYLLLAAFFVTDWISALVIYLRFYQHQRRLLNNKAASPEQAEESMFSVNDNGDITTDSSHVRKLLRKVYGATGLSGTLSRWLLALLLIPLISSSMHITAAVLTVIVLFSLMRDNRMYTWNFFGLDVQKCVIFRSFVVGFLEAPCAIAFTSWAYLATKKSEVGKYINDFNFFLGLITSMLHVLLELYELKELLVRNNHSLLAALSEISDVRSEEVVMPGDWVSPVTVLSQARMDVPELEIEFVDERAGGRGHV